MNKLVVLVCVCMLGCLRSENGGKYTGNDVAEGDGTVATDGVPDPLDQVAADNSDGSSGSDSPGKPDGQSDTDVAADTTIPSDTVNPDGAQQVCGDGFCEGDETCGTCQTDCGECPPGCGNNDCDYMGGESCLNCPDDCGKCGESQCGDGLCMSPETCSDCQADCGMCQVCGDGFCSGSETCENCEGDCGGCAPACGDSNCQSGDGETCSNCPNDCGPCPYCGDGACNNNETCADCVSDCGSCPLCEGYTGGDGCCAPGNTCGWTDNGVCDCQGKCDWEAPSDCNFNCGDGFCNFPHEDCNNCLTDCPTCTG